MRMQLSTNRFSLQSFLAVLIALLSGDALFAAAPAPIGISVKAGAPRAWQAGWQVTPYSTVSLRHGNVLTVIPITSWSGRGPSIHMALYHNSKSPVSGISVAPASGVNLGAGWTFSYGGQLELVNSTETWVIHDDGTIDKFTKPSSTWVAPTGVHDSLETITGGWKLTHKDRSYRKYDTNGRLTAVGQVDGNEVVIAYATVASHSRISTVTDAAGRVLTFGYNTTTGDLTSLTAPLTSSTTRQWTLGYSSGKLSTVTDPLSHDITIATDGTGRITEVADENGPTGTIAYDSGTGVLITDPEPFDDQTVNIEYETDNDGVRRTVYDRRGSQWYYRFDGTDDELILTQDPVGNYNTFTYDSNLNRLTFTNGNNKTWTYTYDSYGNQLTITDPLSNVTTMTYNGSNRLLTQTEPDEITPSRRVTTYTYDSSTLYLLTVTDPNSEVVTYTYYGGSDHPEWTGKVKTRTDRVGTVTKYEYDDYGQLETQIADFGTGLLNETTTYENNKAGWRTATVDPCGNRTEYTYNAAGLLTQTVVDPGSGSHLAITTSYTYDDGNRRVTMTDPMGTVTQYDYDELNRLVRTTEGYGLTGYGFETEYEYDANGNRTLLRDANLNETEWVYDDANRLIEVIDAESYVTEYTYDAAGNKIEVKDGNGIETTYTYDDINRLTSTTVDPGSSPHLNILTQYAYATSGSGGCGCGGTAGGSTVKRIIDGEGEYTFFEYDLLNRRISTIRKVGDTSSTADSNDHVTNTVYDDEGRVLSTTILGDSGADLVTSHTYDHLGRRLTTAIDPSGLNLVTTSTYDACGNLETMTGPSGNTITHTYDAARRRTFTEDEVGDVETLDYDDAGRVTCRSDGEGNDTLYAYNAVGQLYTMTDALGKDTDYTYDNTGHVWTVTDANSNTTWTLYDGMYRLVYREDPVEGIVEYTYDGVGNQLTQKALNESGTTDDQLTTYTYDAANRRVTEEYPDDESGTYDRSFQYNKVGNVTSRTDQNGDVTSYSYDDLHRLIGRSYTVNSGTTYPSTQGPDSFAYDRTGRIIGADREYGSADLEIDLTYDKAGRVTSVTEAGHTIGYDYVVGPTRNYREVAYPTGRVIYEDMDGRGRVIEISDAALPIIIAANEYDDADRLIARCLGNDTAMEREYDAAGRVSLVDHFTTGSPSTIVAKVSYGRDPVGNSTWREDLQMSTHSETYAYDDTNRLIEFERGTLNTSTHEISTLTGDANLTQRNEWTLDKLGNWDELVKQVNSVSVTEPRTNNKANEYLTMDPDGSGGSSLITLVHDDNGNLKDDGTYLYEYDIENRMTRVKLKSSSAVLAEYHYDALGRRIRKIIPTGQAGAGTWTYVINGQWQVLSEFLVATGEEEAIPVREYCHGGRTAYVDDHVAMFNIYIDGEEWSEQWYWYHSDAQFCTVAMTDGFGSVAERSVTDPYGMTITYTSAWGTPQATSRLGNPFMHQGLWLDDESGKYQNRYRDYLPTLGRFAQRDPLQYANGANLNAAYLENPVELADPAGTVCTPPGVYPVFLFTCGGGPIAQSGVSSPTTTPTTSPSTQPVPVPSCFEVGTQKAHEEKLELEKEGYDPRSNDFKMFHCLEACNVQKACFGNAGPVGGTLGAAGISLAGIIYEILVAGGLKPPDGTGKGWHRDKPFDGQHPKMWCIDTPGDVLANEIGVGCGLAGADCKSCCKEAHRLIPGPDYRMPPGWVNPNGPGDLTSPLNGTCVPINFGNVPIILKAGP